MTEKELRNKSVAIIKSWRGLNEKDGSHKKIIDIYNSHKPLARGYKLKYTDPWCAGTVSAVSIEAGNTDIAPTECSCSKMIELYKKIGRWVEADNYVPDLGDLMIYDWDDSGKGECTGDPEHVGMVIEVAKNVITVMEGNNKNAVAPREIPVNGRYIRGYCVPNYASKADKKSETTPATVKVTVTLPTLKKGCEGDSVAALQILLNGLGYNCGEVDGDFGTKTEKAVRAFQKARKLTVDGIVGAKTWAALLS